jgi:hypothetical protein
MKVGIFVSTQIRNPRIIKRNLDFLLDSFDNSEFVFGIWTYQKIYGKILEKYSDKILYVDEPIIHYDPYIDNPTAIMHHQYQKKLKAPNERHKHQTKQILIHNELMKKYETNYDVIVRCRYDTTISPFIDFNQFIDECYEKPATIAISTRTDYHPSILTVGEFASNDYPYMYHRSEGKYFARCVKTTEMLLDNGVLIHKSSDWNSELVEKLHSDKKLLAAEFGWWQILVDGTSHNNWKHYDGGAGISRTLIDSDREILKKYEILRNNY